MGIELEYLYSSLMKEKQINAVEEMLGVKMVNPQNTIVEFYISGTQAHFMFVLNWGEYLKDAEKVSVRQLSHTRNGELCFRGQLRFFFSL